MYSLPSSGAGSPSSVFTSNTLARTVMSSGQETGKLAPPCRLKMKTGKSWLIAWPISVDVDTSKELDAIMERNLSTPDGGAEDGGEIDGADHAQQANLDIAAVMGEWTADVRYSSRCHLMKA
ncbi:hypothetical protein KIN20_012628 [Parelaphostrongylus tenuis]|uniref:Uncharacterized protein n=1 Tax=Parelaphostrongylus tenuis TaxID=148309 RepID=A0AAD5MB23_PARTN|nr:hypothetical protein KIN20_012628 [Parelaphostrongylus tenuis]